MLGVHSGGKEGAVHSESLLNESCESLLDGFESRRSTQEPSVSDTAGDCAAQWPPRSMEGLCGNHSHSNRPATPCLTPSDRPQLSSTSLVFQQSAKSATSSASEQLQPKDCCCPNDRDEMLLRAMRRLGMDDISNQLLAEVPSESVTNRSSNGEEAEQPVSSHLSARKHRSTTTSSVQLEAMSGCRAGDLVNPFLRVISAHAQSQGNSLMELHSCTTPDSTLKVTQSVNDDGPIESDRPCGPVSIDVFHCEGDEYQGTSCKTECCTTCSKYTGGARSREGMGEEFQAGFGRLNSPEGTTSRMESPAGIPQIYSEAAVLHTSERLSDGVLHTFVAQVKPALKGEIEEAARSIQGQTAALDADSYNQQAATDLSVDGLRVGRNDTLAVEQVSEVLSDVYLSSLCSSEGSEGVGKEPAGPASPGDDAEVINGVGLGTGRPGFDGVVEDDADDERIAAAALSTWSVVRSKSGDGSSASGLAERSCEVAAGGGGSALSDFDDCESLSELAFVGRPVDEVDRFDVNNGLECQEYQEVIGMYDDEEWGLSDALSCPQHGFTQCLPGLPVLAVGAGLHVPRPVEERDWYCSVPAEEFDPWTIKMESRISNICDVKMDDSGTVYQYPLRPSRPEFTTKIEVIEDA